VSQAEQRDERGNTNGWQEGRILRAGRTKAGLRVRILAKGGSDQAREQLCDF